MKRYFYLIFLLMLLQPIKISAQNAQSMLDQVITAINQSHWEEANNLYRIAVDMDAFRSERFLNEKVESNCPSRPAMLMYLGDYFKRTRDYDNAYIYYKKLVETKSNDINYLTRLSDMEVQLGKESDALISYQSIAAIDGNNLAANIFLGNYYFCEAEKKLNLLNNDYKKIYNPSHMQMATYKDQKAQIYEVNYKRAKLFFDKVVKRFPSAEVFKNLKKIQVIETEIREGK